VALLMYKCLHGLAPSYLAEFRKPVASVQGWQHLRSAASGMLSVPRARNVFGSRNFAIYGPTTWNSLPNDLRALELPIGTFMKRLKTYLFHG
jgi:hypothetical protein